MISLYQTYKILRIFENSKFLSEKFCPSGHITADKRLRYALLKSPLATSFIRKTLGEIAFKEKNNGNYRLKCTLVGKGGY